MTASNDFDRRLTDWLEDGPRTAQQDVVAKLGTDVAVWGIGAPAIYIPTGIVKLEF